MSRTLLRTRRAVRGVSLSAVLALVLAACAAETTTTAGEETTTTAAAATGTGVFSTYIGEPESLTPPNTNESEGIAVLRALFTGLVRYDPRTSEAINAVASSIEGDDEGKTWTITLEEGWTFHDGSPVTASSFVDAWNYTAYGPNAQQNNSFFANIEGYDAVSPADPDGEDGPQEAPEPTAETLSGLEVVDDLTFRVTLTDADPQFPIKLGYAAYFPLPEAFFDDPAAFNEEPVGNGPFMMDGPWEHDVEIRTVAYPDYAGEDVPRSGGITFQIYADQNTAYNDLLAGNLDVMDLLPAEQVEAARTEFGDRFGESPSTSFNYLAFPLYLPEFQNPDLRRALSMAIDKEAITETIFNGSRDPAFSVIPPSLPGHRESVCPNWEYDPETARELFDAAGGWTGPMTIWFNSGAGHEDWVEAVSNMWRDTLGIEEYNFEQLEFADYLGRLDNREATGAFRLGWGMDYPSPQNFLEPLFASYNAPPVGSNSAFYESEEFDSLIAEGNAAAVDGLEAAVPIYQQAEDVLCEDTPVIPMFFGKNQFAWSERVDGVFVDAFGDINYTEIEVVG